MPKQLLWIAAFGALGTVARFGLASLIQAWAGKGGFAWGTFAVNAIGCLLYGVVWQLCEERLWVSESMRTTALAGFMGAFTTFSTFAFESTQHMRQSEWALALGNIAAQNVAGIALVVLGMSLVRQLS